MFAPTDAHSRMSPSRLQRILDCPGSFAASQKIEPVEDEQSPYAEEGSRLHLAIEMHLEKHPLTGLSKPIDPTLVNPPLDQEQQNAVQDCLDYLKNLKRTVNPANMFVEKRVFLKHFHQVLYEVEGTADIILQSPKELHVLDWKFGVGVPVYAADNDQLYAYAAGAYAEYQSISKIIIHVVQPRLENFDSVELTPKELTFWVESRLIPGVQRAYEPHAPFNPGQKQCRWCPAKARCRARFNIANQTAADIFAAHEKLPNQVSLDELAQLLDKADLLQSYISDIRVLIQREIQLGRPIKGWKLVHGRSLRKWRQEEEAEKVLLDVLEYDELYKSKLISPAQAERLLKKHKLHKEEWFVSLIEKPEGKPTLVKENDKRPPIEYRTIEQIFSKE